MNFEDQKAKSLLDLLVPFKLAIGRYWKIAWAPAVVVFLLVLVLALFLPSYYNCDVMIFIQPQKISSKIVEAPEKEEQQERLEALIQEVMSRARLRAMIEQYGLYPEYQGVVQKERALAKFRKAIEIQPVVSASGKPLSQTYRVTYVHQDPKTAFEVTKALANLFVEESTISQTTEVGGTVEFFDSQLRKAKTRLEEIELAVQKFERENFGKLPTHLEQAIQTLQNARSQQTINSQIITTNVSRINSLQREMNLTRQETAGMSTGNTIDVTDPEVALAQLKQALQVLRSRYSDIHPEVERTRKQIETLEKQKRTGKAGGGMSFAGGQEVRNIRREIGELEAQTESLKKQNEELKATVAKLEVDLNAMPLKEQELIAIKRDYANEKANYDQLKQAREQAALQYSMVKSQKSAQFRVVDAPSEPVIPAGPARLIIALVGLFVAGLIFFGIPLGLSLINDSFKFRNEIEDELGVGVLGIIPPMRSPTAYAIMRRAASTSLLASTVAFMGGALLIFFVV